MSCQHPNPPGYTFCATCGTQLDIVRCYCGFSNIKSNLYCGQCGLKLEALNQNVKPSLTSTTSGKYNLTEFIANVEVQIRQDEVRKLEEAAKEENSETMSQDDIANFFANPGDGNHE